MKLLAAAVTAGIVTLASPPRPAIADTRQFRIATLAPAGSPWMDILERAGAEIEDKTGGRVTIKYYPGGQQGDERDFIRKIRAGQLDGAAVTAVGLSMIEPSIRVLELPMLFENLDELDYVATKMWPYFQKKFEAKGFRLADRGEIGWIYFFSKNKVTTLAELRRQRLPVLADEQIGVAIRDKLKLSGVPLGIPEIDAALTAGRIDGCFSSPVGAIALQWYRKVRYMSSTPMVYAIGATVYALEAEAKVSAEDRKLMEGIARVNQKKARRIIRKANEDAHKTLLRQGITVVDVPKAMLDEMAALAATVRTELIGKVYSKEELDMVIAYRDEYRARHAGRAAENSAAAR